jgi:hypothetical protein
MRLYIRPNRGFALKLSGAVFGAAALASIVAFSGQPIRAATPHGIWPTGGAWLWQRYSGLVQEVEVAPAGAARLDGLLRPR